VAPRLTLAPTRNTATARGPSGARDRRGTTPAPCSGLAALRARRPASARRALASSKRLSSGCGRRWRGLYLHQFRDLEEAPATRVPETMPPARRPKMRH